MLSVTFCGAARTVTGSQYFLQYQAPDGSLFNFCLDSGLFQTGQKINLYKINSHLLFDPRKLDAIVLTHAHLDHCGRIPYLVKNGFGGKIYSTLATMQIAEVVMLDAARLNAEANSTNNPLKGIKKRTNENLVSDSERFSYQEIISTIGDGVASLNLEMESLGLYGQEDVVETMRRFKTFEYHHKFNIHPNLQVEFWDAGHILGSACTVFTELSSGKKIVFSGDLGNRNKPIIQDPEIPQSYPELTHIFTETTYGNRLHGKLDPKERLRKIISETVKENGLVLLPSFSIERAQEVIYYIVELMQENKIPRIPIFLDSPMASKVLQICLEHPELYDPEMQDKIRQKANPLISKNIQILETPAQSKSLNQYEKPCIIIAGSGMLNGGRILKHLVYHLENPRNTLLMVGYQAVGTLGRQILDGSSEILVEGKMLEVKTRVENINEFSAHADQAILKNWVVDLTQEHSNSKKVKLFLMHGEKDASLTFGQEIEAMLPNKIESYWPRFGEKVELWS